MRIGTSAYRRKHRLAVDCFVPLPVPCLIDVQYLLYVVDFKIRIENMQQSLLLPVGMIPVRDEIPLRRSNQSVSLLSGWYLTDAHGPES